jgi:hypothetical protein
MAARLGRDFSDVRVHDTAAASAAARAVWAEAFTVGHHVVFEGGRYAPGTGPGERLLAHELSHVVQQAGRPIPAGRLPIVPFDAPSEREAAAGAARAGPHAGTTAVTAVQRSPLSDSVRAAWTADSTIEALLARLAQGDVQAAQSDADVDAEIARLLANRPNDLWVAHRIRQGRLGQTTGNAGVTGAGPVRPIEAFYVRGRTNRHALLIAGVHGIERQGIEVARMVLADLQTQRPLFSVIVVPSLFPHAAASGRFGQREGATLTNRNFPEPTEDLAAARAAGGGTPVDATVSGGRRRQRILPENVMLLELIERFHPERIISIHGTHRAGAAGVFADPRNLRSDEVLGVIGQRIGAIISGASDERRPGESWLDMQQRLLADAVAARRRRAREADQQLTERAAGQIDAATSSITGRERRQLMNRETDPDPLLTAGERRRQPAHRRAHPSVAGNVDASGGLTRGSWSGGTPGGVSLGDYASARGYSIVTVEPPINRTTGDYPTRLDTISQADRRVELQAYADAVRTVLLGQ